MLSGPGLSWTERLHSLQQEAQQLESRHTTAFPKGSQLNPTCAHCFKPIQGMPVLDFQLHFHLDCWILNNPRRVDEQRDILPDLVDDNALDAFDPEC
jgi:hypothetical protein